VNADYERSFFDYLYVVIKWRRLIVVCAVVVTVASAGVSFLLPKAWTADVKLLPPEQGAFDELSLSAMAGANVPSGLMGLVGSKTPSDRLLTMLASRKVLEAVVDRFGLVQRYEARDRAEAMSMLEQTIDTDVRRDGTLVVLVTAAAPGEAAQIANYLAARLDTVNREYKRNQAAAMRKFLQGRVHSMEGEFREAGLALQRFQDRHKLVDPETQTIASVEVMKTIVQELAELEVKLGIAEQQLDAEHEERRVLELEQAALRNQLENLYGSNGAPSSFQTLGPSLRELPSVLREYSELAVDVKIRQEILGFLGTKLEEAEYREALNTPTIQILDQAVAPTVRSAPRRTLIVLASLAVTLILSTVLAFVFESWNRLESTDQARVESIRKLFRK
jgi:tyrosine-protein kinase Etk/Wzc